MNPYHPTSFGSDESSTKEAEKALLRVCQQEVATISCNDMGLGKTRGLDDDEASEDGK